jgi:hypothetical protein
MTIRSARGDTRSFYGTFLKLCKHRYVMQPLQNPPFCISTSETQFVVVTVEQVIPMPLLVFLLKWVKIVFFLNFDSNIKNKPQ